MAESSGPSLRFAKGEALGNDYLVVDEADLPWPMTPARARALCDRHRGAGADGVLIADLRAAEPSLRILNPDGSEAEKSGNGLRIFAAWLHGRGKAGREPFRVRLARDTVTLCVEELLDGGTLSVRAELGAASFRGYAVGFRPHAGDVLGRELPLPDGLTAEVTTVSLANPHCVVFVDVLDRADFLRRAPLLCVHEAFAEGVNVQFARLLGTDRIEAWIWERGAGETLASGSSACAVAAAAVRRAFMQPGPIRVEMPGGAVTVGVSPDFRVTLRGPARIVYDGELAEGVVRVWGALD